MFILLLILIMICTVLFAYLSIKDYWIGAGVIFVSIMFLIFATTMVHFANVEVGKVEALKSVGIEPLSNKQVYEMSRKELDMCLQIHTFEKTYYFAVEEDK